MGSKKAGQRKRKSESPSPANSSWHRKRRKSNLPPPMMGRSDPSLQELNLVLCGSDEALKSSISDLILGLKNVKTGEVCGHRLRLEVMPALYNTQLSDQEVMNKILHCFHLDIPVQAFLLIIHVGPVTDDDKGEIEMIQRTFGSSVCDHSLVLFTTENLNEAAAINFVKQSSEMKELRHLFGDRYVILKKLKKHREKQVAELLEQVTNMKKIYSLQMYIEAQKDGVRQPLEHELAEIKKQLKTKPLEECAEDENSNCLRLLLLGKTGNGKSATGNTILGREEFESDVCLTSVTKKCQKGIGEVQGRSVTVVDTPGLFDSALSNEEVMEEIGKCVSMLAPGPHAFIIVLSLGRFTEEEKKTVNLIRGMFGPEAAKYSIVLFTGGDKLKNKTLEEYLKTGNSPHVNNLIRNCGGRVHLFNNCTDDTAQVSKLLEMIEDMTKFNTKKFFTNKIFRKAEAAIQQKEKEMLKEMEDKMQAEKEALKASHEEKLEQMRKQLEEERCKKKNIFKEREQALRREYKKREKEQRQKWLKENQRREEEEKRQSAENKRMMDEMRKELKNQKAEFRKNLRGAENDQKDRTKEEIERKLREREMQWKKQMKERDEKFKRTKERHAEELRAQEEHQEQMRKDFEKEIERERNEWQKTKRRNRGQLEKEYTESKKKIMQQYEKQERMRKEEWNKRIQEEDERREEEKQSLQRLKEKIEAERQEEIKRREKEDKIRKEKEDRDCEKMKNDYERKLKEMQTSYQNEVRRKAEEISNLEEKHKNYIKKLIAEHQHKCKRLETELDRQREQSKKSKGWSCVIT